MNYVGLSKRATSGVWRERLRVADVDGVGASLDNPPVVLAAKGGLVKMVKFLLRIGANVDAATPRDGPCDC